MIEKGAMNVKFFLNSIKCISDVKFWKMWKMMIEKGGMKVKFSLNFIICVSDVVLKNDEEEGGMNVEFPLNSIKCVSDVKFWHHYRNEKTKNL